MLIKIKKLHPDALIPIKKHKNDAAYDLFALEDADILPGQVTIVRTGLSIEIPPGFKGEVYSRSGLAKQGVFVVNQPGKIDSGYTGEILVMLTALSDSYEIGKEDRIAQLEVNPINQLEFEVVEELETSERGSNGFGSTGR